MASGVNWLSGKEILWDSNDIDACKTWLTGPAHLDFSYWQKLPRSDYNHSDWDDLNKAISVVTGRKDFGNSSSSIRDKCIEVLGGNLGGRKSKLSGEQEARISREVCEQLVWECEKDEWREQARRWLEAACDTMVRRWVAMWKKWLNKQSPEKRRELDMLKKEVDDDGDLEMADLPAHGEDDGASISTARPPSVSISRARSRGRGSVIGQPNFGSLQKRYRDSSLSTSFSRHDERGQRAWGQSILIPRDTLRRKPTTTRSLLHQSIRVLPVPELVEELGIPDEFLVGIGTLLSQETVVKMNPEDISAKDVKWSEFLRACDSTHRNIRLETMRLYFEVNNEVGDVERREIRDQDSLVSAVTKWEWDFHEVGIDTEMCLIMEGDSGM